MIPNAFMDMPVKTPVKPVFNIVVITTGYLAGAAKSLAVRGAGSAITVFQAYPPERKSL